MAARDLFLKAFSIFGQEKLELFIMTTWAAWMSRSRCLFSHEAKPPTILAPKDETYLASFQSVSM